MSTLQLTVPSMACSACADTISNAVHAITSLTPPLSKLQIASNPLGWKSKRFRSALQFSTVSR
ncbi:MAG: hypothetical protein ACFE0J_11825 [Elainellaceae cyanobacterium]